MAGIRETGFTGPPIASPRPSPALSFFRRARVVVPLGVLAVAAVASATVAVTDADAGQDFGGVVTASGRDLATLNWRAASVVIVLSLAHYLATALAARAAAGLPLPLSETVRVQLAASAANRITPAGLGGAAVNARYFSRRGLDVGAAIGAVGALSVLGGVADVAAFAALIGLGSLVGLPGGTQELSTLGQRLGAAIGSLGSLGTMLTLLVLALVLGMVVRTLRRHGRAVAGRRLIAPLLVLRHRPRAMVVLLASSAATTLILAAAFVATATMIAGPQPKASLGALLVAFMAAAALGNAVPVPAGIGSTETALVGVLVTAQVPAAHATVIVLCFRILTFWLPALVGVPVAANLRRHGVL